MSAPTPQLTIVRCLNLKERKAAHNVEARVKQAVRLGGDLRRSLCEALDHEGFEEAVLHTNPSGNLQVLLNARTWLSYAPLQ